MLFFSLMRVGLHLLRGLLTVALVYPLTAPARRRLTLQRWSADLLVIFGVRVRFLNGAAGAAQAHAMRALIVSNHVSWLDIFVINSVLPCRFVAKSDIRDWPAIGWLCHKAGTIFISRGRARDVRRIFKSLVESLRMGEHVAFFPEGTTAAQGTLLPFHANLFEAAIDAEVPVLPFALRYLDGRGGLHPAAEYIGDTTFIQSMVMILQGGGMQAELVMLPSIASVGAHRRELSLEAHAAIASAWSEPLASEAA
jgi:1-acyl-sn-glycerol-3-phosphate acyltransferase